MIQWDGHNRGVFDRYEVMLVPEPNHLWSLYIWVRKTLIDRKKGIYTLEEAREIAEEKLDRLFKDAKNLEQRLYKEDSE